MVSQGLQCLNHSVSSTTNPYTQALLAYTFTLAGKMDIRNILLEKLDRQAIISGMLAMLGIFCFLVFILFIYFWPCYVACGIEPGPTAVKTLSPNHWTAREIPGVF